jgi:hypothetical protein
VSQVPGSSRAPADRRASRTLPFPSWQTNTHETPGPDVGAAGFGGPDSAARTSSGTGVGVCVPGAMLTHVRMAVKISRPATSPRTETSYEVRPHRLTDAVRSSRSPRRAGEDHSRLALRTM